MKRSKLTLVTRSVLDIIILSNTRSEKMKDKKLKMMIFTALFAAMTFALTFSVKLPMPGGGYIHLGDAMIYLSACILPTPFAMLAAGVGGAMADFAGGYAIYVVPTLIIKALIAIPFSSKSSKILTTRNVVASIGAGAITIVGYYFAKLVLVSMASSRSFFDTINGIFQSKNLLSALASVPENIIQSVGSAILFVIIAFALDKIKIKERISKLF